MQVTSRQPKRFYFIYTPMIAWTDLVLRTSRECACATEGLAPAPGSVLGVIRCPCLVAQGRHSSPVLPDVVVGGAWVRASSQVHSQ